MKHLIKATILIILGVTIFTTLGGGGIISKRISQSITNTDSERTRHLKSILLEKPLYIVDTIGLRVIHYFDSNGIYNQKFAERDGISYGKVNVDYTIKEGHLSVHYPNRIECDFSESDGDFITMSCDINDQRYTWTLWEKLSDAVKNPSDTFESIYFRNKS